MHALVTGLALILEGYNMPHCPNGTRQGLPSAGLVCCPTFSKMYEATRRPWCLLQGSSLQRPRGIA